MKLATSTGDFDRFCDTYLERIKHIYSAGFKYIDLSLYTVMENDPLILSDDWQRTVEEIKAALDSCSDPSTNPCRHLFRPEHLCGLSQNGAAGSLRRYQM